MSYLQLLAMATLLACATTSYATTPPAPTPDAAPAASTLGNETGAQDADTVIHNIKGVMPDLRFSLTGAGNKTITQKDFSGKVVMLFFGYASCPDICPTTMAQLAQVIQNLGSDAARVRIVFVSVDPHRDTPEKLQKYVNAFGHNAVGLTGNERQIADVARRYRVAYQIEKPKGKDADNYDVAHGRGVYIFDPAGHARLLASDANSTSALTRDVRALLH
jgi:protein SCO1/2